ncbi:MAG TPA: 50S ribosomal protein L33 [bacterium]|nr:50S ribosomal protein L33 [bacterium]
MAKPKKKNIIALECTVCKKRNYTEYKNINVKEKREKTKYCRSCLTHTKHVEVKMK